MAWIKWFFAAAFLSAAAYYLSTSGLAFRIYAKVYSWSFEADGTSISDDFLRDMWVNTFFSIVQVTFTSLIISFVFNRKQAREERRAKKYLASSLRDELFEYVVSQELAAKLKRFGRIEAICDRAEASMQRHEWSVADRFRDALTEHHDDPANEYSRAILEIRFRNLAERLCVTGSELEAFCDRISVAFTYRGGYAQ
jgi:hypothetical protein